MVIKNSLISRTLALNTAALARPGRIISQQFAIILQCGTAGGAVGDDEFHIRLFEEGDILTGLLRTCSTIPSPGRASRSRQSLWE